MTSIHKTQGSKDTIKYFKEGNQRHKDVVRTGHHVGTENRGLTAERGVLAVHMVWRGEATLVGSLYIPYISTFYKTLSSHK